MKNKKNTDMKTDSKATNGRVQRLVRYLFVRRLAIMPHPIYPEDPLYKPSGCKAKGMFFEWQSIPEGYRWF